MVYFIRNCLKNIKKLRFSNITAFIAFYNHNILHICHLYKLYNSHLFLNLQNNLQKLVF